MITPPSFPRWLLALTLAAVLAGCETPPPKPPKPHPVTSADLPPPRRGAEDQAGAMPGGITTGEGGPGAPGPGQGYGAASPDAAEVEVEEIAADGSTTVISSSSRAQLRAQQNNAADTQRSGGDSRSLGNSGGGGGGGNMPSGVAPNNPRLGANPGGHSQAVPVQAGRPDLIGTQVEIGAPASVDLTRPGPTNTPPEAAQSLGRPSGREDGRGQRLEDDGRARGSGGSADTRTGLGNSPDKVGATSGAPRALSGLPPPPDAIDTRRDDIVAVQLREAAEKEQDPLLREKLWVEYRKYKAGL